ncbi:MAG: phage resistance protein [Leptolyngbya sp. SIO4C5]|nr:phage resistance protein [Leptolyngbya sp. SIO4C5]
MTLIKDLIDIPERLQKGDFVLKLTEGVTRPEATLKDYVVTPELKDRFDNALTFIQSAIQTNSSKASYLHGSFGSGKSHFMAVLNLILEDIAEAKGIKELAPVITKHNEWMTGKQFLLVPYHMLGAHDMESGILGGYVEFIRREHPEASIPGVYLAEGLFKDAQTLRETMGDDKFFSALSETASSDSGWGELAAGWDRDRFEAAIAAGPGDDERAQLISALIKQFFGSYNVQAAAQGEAFVSLDQGLSIISKHARDLGYDALILFLDELILWLASRATDLKFIHQEGQKLSKLVEAQLADRPIPIVSFVARQRDLSELIGDSIPGAERLNFSDALQHWEGRFHHITLEDRNLPAIAEKRVLKCKSKATREELDAAFEQTAKVRESVMNVLLTSEGDREMFRQVYPFSPALVQTLIAVSSVLQRERTALKVMMQLLVDHRETLTVGDIIPVGDLFDVVAHGDEAFSPEIAIHFNNAKRLYQQKLLPELEKSHGRLEELEKLPLDDPSRVTFRNDDRLVKTLLLSALVPEVESLRGLNAERLTSLNHGTIKSPIPGRESQLVLQRCRNWAASVGEIRIGDEMRNPSISVQLSGVDTDTILKQAEREDNRGNRLRLIRDMVYSQLEIQGEDQFEQYHDLIWKNTKRACVVIFGNIRELPEGSMENLDDRWKVIIDYPFDEATFSPKDDRQKCEAFKQSHPEGAKTLVWIPSFFGEDAKKELGTLLILEHVLTGERFSGYANHLSPQDRQTAKSLLENQRSVLRQRVLNHLDAAYGISNARESLDAATSLELNEQFVSLQVGFELQPPTAASLADGLQNLLEQALTHEFPAAPDFETDVSKFSHLQKVYQYTSQAAQNPQGRVEVDYPTRRILRQIANPLKLGEMGADATHFVLGQHWRQHFTRKIAELGSTPQVRQLREWIDQPKPMGLSKELQNLIILTFADQTGRSFFLHTNPRDVTLKDIPNECELREQRLPDESVWKTARQRADEIFGVSVADLRKASTVADLAAKVQAKAKAAVENCQGYVQSLQDSLETLNLSQECDRMITASTTLAMVEQLSAAKEDDVVELLGECAIATSAAAMAECMKKADNLTRSLNSDSWAIFQIVAELSGDLESEAKRVLQTLSEALRSDEHVISLDLQLKQSLNQALRLLREQSKSETPRPEPPDKQPHISPVVPDPTETKVIETSDTGTATTTVRTVSEGRENNLSLTATKELLDKLGKGLKASENVRLSISWIIEETHHSE